MVTESISEENKHWNKDRKFNKYTDVSHKHVGNFGEKVKVFVK